MKYAADFRRIARDALFTRWPIATLACFIASLVGGSIASAGGGGSISINEDANVSFGNTEIPLDRFINVDMVAIVTSVLLFIGLIAVLWVIALCIIGGAAKLGYASFNLNLVDKKDVKISDIFSQFHRIGDGFLMDLLMTVYILFWSMLFVIPGIVKSFSYAMTPYILYEHPELSPNAAITESRKMMDGNKGRLFCLELSFIGWHLLASLPAVIGGIALLFGFLGLFIAAPLFIISCIASYCVGAYQEAAQAAFYREISYVPEPEITVEQ